MTNYARIFHKRNSNLGGESWVTGALIVKLSTTLPLIFDEKRCDWYVCTLDQVTTDILLFVIDLQAELDLLMMDETEDNKRHFNLKNLIEDGKKKKKKKKVKWTEKSKTVDDDFEVFYML